MKYLYPNKLQLFAFLGMILLLGSSGVLSEASADPLSSLVTPTGFNAKSNHQQVTLNWDPQFHDDGSEVTKYIITYTDGSRSKSQNVDDPTSQTIKNLTNNMIYAFVIQAVDIDGVSSILSDPIIAIPAFPASVFGGAVKTVPDAPTNLATISGDKEIILLWNKALDSNGSKIDNYIILYVDHNNNIELVPHNGNGKTITNLQNNFKYTFKVISKVGDKYSVASTSAFATPIAAADRTIPDAPTNLKAIPDNAKVTLSWTASVVGTTDTPVDYYIISYTDGTDWFEVQIPHTSIDIPGLTNGVEYTFYIQVFSSNTKSYSAPFVVSTPVVGQVAPTAPGIPTALTATRGNTEVSLSWTAPANTGGAAITDYKVEHSIDSVTWIDFDDGKGTSTDTTVTGLTNGQEYNFRVFAINSVGTSISSFPQVQTPALTAPGIPTGLTTDPGNKQVKLDWTTVLHN